MLSDVQLEHSFVEGGYVSLYGGVSGTHLISINCMLEVLESYDGDQCCKKNEEERKNIIKPMTRESHSTKQYLTVKEIGCLVEVVDYLLQNSQSQLLVLFSPKDK